MTDVLAAPSPWRDLTDPRRATDLDIDELETGLKEPLFENLEIPEGFGPVSITVDDHKMKRFSFTQDDYSPWYLREGPFDGTRIGHPALLGNDLLQLFTTRYRASQTVGFHTEEQMWFDSPVKLGETVTLSGSYTEAFVRRGQGYVVMEAKAVAQDGRTIVRHRGLEIFRTVPGAIGGRATETPQRKVSGEIPTGARMILSVDQSASVDDVLAPMTKTITAEQAAVFSRVGEYVLNIHNNLEIARRGKLPTLIVQGQQQYGMVAGYLAQMFGRAWFTQGWLQMKFIAPLQVFDPMTVTGLVTAVAELSDGKRKIDLEVWVRRGSDSRMTAIGWASGIIGD